MLFFSILLATFIDAHYFDRICCFMVANILLCRSAVEVLEFELKYRVAYNFTLHVRRELRILQKKRLGNRYPYTSTKANNNKIDAFDGGIKEK